MGIAFQKELSLLYSIQNKLVTIPLTEISHLNPQGFSEEFSVLCLTVTVFSKVLTACKDVQCVFIDVKHFSSFIAS